MLKPSVLSWDGCYVSYTDDTKVCPSCCGCCQAQSSIEFLDMPALVPFGLGTGPGDGEQNAAILTPQRCRRGSVTCAQGQARPWFQMICEQPNKIVLCEQSKDLGLIPNAGFLFSFYLPPGTPLQLWFLKLSSATKVVSSGRVLKGDCKRKYKLSLDHTLLSEGAPNIRTWW